MLETIKYVQSHFIDSNIGFFQYLIIEVMYLEEGERTLEFPSDMPPIK